MEMEELIKLVGFIAVLLVPPMIPVILLWLFLNPVAFWERLATLVILLIVYLVMVVGWLVIISAITD